eukprot:scaffold18338_cov60-Phaeocystis_antarctica.AAC.1
MCWHTRRSEGRQRLLEQLRARSMLASLAARLNPADEAEGPAAECVAVPSLASLRPLPPRGEAETGPTVVQGEPLRASSQEI